MSGSWSWLPWRGTRPPEPASADSAPPDSAPPDAALPELVEGRDYEVEPNGAFVFTAAYHLRRGFCCGNGCRHCPYEPRWGGA